MESKQSREGLGRGSDHESSVEIQEQWEQFGQGWPENTDSQSVDPPTDPVHGLPYGPVHGPLLRTPSPPYRLSQKIAEKKNEKKI